MPPRTPTPSRAETQPTRRAPFIITIASLLLSLVILTLLDAPILHLLFDPTHQIEDHLWYKALRAVGFLGTWFAAAIILAIIDAAWKRAGALALAPLCAAAIAELTKLIIGRARPIENGQLIEPGYHFRPFLNGFRDGHNLGMPSSHAAVAFAAAFVIIHHAPRTKPIAIPLALGCAYTRIASGAHFPSDVFVGAVIGWALARAFRALTCRIHGPNAVPSTNQ